MVYQQVINGAATLGPETVSLEYLSAEASKHFLVVAFSAVAAIAKAIAGDRIASAWAPKRRLNLRQHRSYDGKTAARKEDSGPRSYRCLVWVWGFCRPCAGTYPSYQTD